MAGEVVGELVHARPGMDAVDGGGHEFGIDGALVGGDHEQVADAAPGQPGAAFLEDLLEPGQLAQGKRLDGAVIIDLVGEVGHPAQEKPALAPDDHLLRGRRAEQPVDQAVVGQQQPGAETEMVVEKGLVAPR